MARIKIRTRKDGLITYQVKFVLGGGRATAGRKEISESFASHLGALEFQEAVEKAGHQWPEGYIRGSADAGPAEPRAEVADVAEASLADVAASFFGYKERQVKLNRNKPYTYHRDRQMYANHLEETFAAMRFRDITPADIADWIEEQSEGLPSARSVGNRHALLFGIMKHGQKRLTLRLDNPCEITDLPVGDSNRQLRFLQHGEWALFKSCLKSDVILMLDVALATGIRWGELAALRREDISFPNDDVAHLHIVRAWSKRSPTDPTPINPDEGENRSWHLEAPKGRKERWVVITGELVQRLTEAVEELDPQEYLFVTRSGTPWRYPDFHSDRWTPAREEAQRRGLQKHVTPHMLRHTTVVWSLADGEVDIHTISNNLGHADETITYKVYSGILNLTDPRMAREMAKQMLIADQAIVPGPSRAEVEARKIRPGARGPGRRRVS